MKWYSHAGFAELGYDADNVTNASKSGKLLDSLGNTLTDDEMAFDDTEGFMEVADPVGAMIVEQLAKDVPGLKRLSDLLETDGNPTLEKL